MIIMIKNIFLFLLVFSYTAYSMNRDQQQVAELLRILPIGMGSPTFIERVLRDAHVPEDRIAQEVHEVYFHGRPLPIPYESVAELLHRLAPTRVIRRMHCPSNKQFLKAQAKIKRHS